MRTEQREEMKNIAQLLRRAHCAFGELSERYGIAVQAGTQCCSTCALTVFRNNRNKRGCYWTMNDEIQLDESGKFSIGFVGHTKVHARELCSLLQFALHRHGLKTKRDGLSNSVDIIGMR